MKRMYVTAHHLKQQQLNKKSVQVGKNVKMPTRKSPRLNKQQQNNEASATKDCASAKRKLVLPEPSHEDECMGDNQLEGSALPPPPPPPPLTPSNKKFAMRIEDYDKGLTDYEKQRAANLKKNNEVLIALNLPTLAAAIKPPDLKKKQKERVQEDSEDYVPEHTEEHDDDSDSEVPAKAATTKKPPQPAEPSLADYEDGEENEGIGIVITYGYL
uniref:Uncharacterized protein n=1 Tax=Daucus carota subsp. sativus TaxID=79200 RepID=A0A166CPP3_DAUCS